MASTTFLSLLIIVILFTIIYVNWNRITNFFLAKKSETEEFIKICPRCGNTNLTIPPAGLDIKMTHKDYCQKCKERGGFPEVWAYEVEAFRKELKERK